MGKNAFKVIAVFVIGTVGGIFADQIFWPYFVERPLFYQYRLEQSPIYVTERKEITNYIQENLALREAIEKVEKVAVGVKSKNKDGKFSYGSGLAVTADGMFVTLADLIPQGSNFYFYIEGQWPSYQVLKRDFKDNLALVKLDKGGLATAGFADFEKIKLGERVFLVGMDFSTTTPQKVVNEGIIKTFDEDLIQTNIFEEEGMAGSPLFNIEGKIVGLSFVDDRGRVLAVPVTKIRRFTGF